MRESRNELEVAKEAFPSMFRREESFERVAR